MRFVLFLLLLSLASTVSAHNLWLSVAESDGGDLVRVVFEHSTEPGEGNYNDTILECGETQVRDLKGGATAVELEHAGEAGARYLKGRTKTDGPRSLEFSCVFGLYKGRLDFFYGQHLDVQTAEQVEDLARAENLLIDIVPAVKEGALELRVLWQGEALPHHRIAVVPPAGKELRLETDEDGLVRYEPDGEGVYGFYSVRVDDSLSGTHKGEAYEGVMHATTLSLPWPLQ